MNKDGVLARFQWGMADINQVLAAECQYRKALRKYYGQLAFSSVKQRRRERARVRMIGVNHKTRINHKSLITRNLFEWATRRGVGVPLTERVQAYVWQPSLHLRKFLDGQKRLYNSVMDFICADRRIAGRERARRNYHAKADEKRAKKRANRLRNLERYRLRARSASAIRRQQPEEKMRLAIRRHVQRMMQLGGTKSTASMETLGCDWKTFMAHVSERLMPGMTLENYGHATWHLDHIRPLISFDMKDPEQFKAAAHYTNLRPMWAFDNLSKGARYAA